MNEIELVLKAINAFKGDAHFGWMGFTMFMSYLLVKAGVWFGAFYLVWKKFISKEK